MKKLLFIMAAWLGLCLAGHVFADTNDIPQICRVAPKKIPVPVSHDAWDSTRVYRQMVLLIEYADTTFSMPDPHAYYDSLLNRPGFNKGAGPGCAAE